MKRIFSTDLPNYLNQTVLLRGHLNNIRALGKLNFLILKDKEGFAQIVIESKEELQKIAHLQPGSVLSIQGVAAESKQAALGVEIVNPKIIVESPVIDVPPVDYYKPEIQSDLDFILDHRPLALRNRKIKSVFKIQAEAAYAYRQYMHDKIDATEYFPPNIIGASSEGGAEFFHVDYFGYNATLAQSSQLYKQIMVGVNEKAFAIVPFFRAENSHTPRHLTEGHQMEFEMGFFDHWHEILQIQEECVKHMLRHINKQCEKELSELQIQLVAAPDNIAFPRITLKEAQEIYFQRTGTDDRKETDLSPAAEKELCKYAFEKFGTDFIFILDWPTSKRPFYTFVNEQRPNITNSFDLLCAGTEITSGGQRRHTLASMLEGLELKAMNLEAFSDYLSIFKFGMPPHGGFGMGLERFVMTILRLKNIREAALFPSDPKRIASNRIKAKIFFGAENIRNEILRQLKEKELSFDLFHRPPGEDSLKTIIVKGKKTGKNYLAVLPISQKLNMKALLAPTGEKCEFEKPAIVMERYGLEINAIPPFGHLLNLETFMDEGLFGERKCTFKSGLSDETIELRPKDLLELTQAKLLHLSQAND